MTIRNSLVLCFGVVFGVLRSRAAETPQPHWLLVTAPAFRAELEPLIAHRRGEGLEVTIVETTNVLSREQIEQGNGVPLREYIQQWAEKSKGPNYVLLAGAVFAGGISNASEVVVPTMKGTLLRMKGQPSDYGYCLAQKDGTPTVAVGRFPARNVEDIRSMVRKTLKVEGERVPAPWQNRVLFLAGDPGGGPLAEMMIEPSLAPRLALLDPSWTTRVIFAIRASRFYLPGRRAHDVFLGSVNEGALITIFAGHSSASAMWITGNNFVTRDDWGRVKTQRGAGLFFTCGCFSCQLRGPDGEGYGITAIRNPNGPSAMIGGTGETFAAPGCLALDGLLSCLHAAPFPSRLADYWRAVQMGLVRGPMDDMTFNLYDQFDGTHGSVPLATQRLEHLEMWMLLGDPALRLPLMPVEVAVKVSGAVRPGAKITVTATTPDRLSQVNLVVTLERPLASLPADVEAFPADSPENRAERDQVMMKNYLRANDYVVAATNLVCEGGPLVCPMEIPATLPWSNLVVRVYVGTTNSAAMGTTVLRVK